jgi:hypothetical protein
MGSNLFLINPHVGLMGLASARVWYAVLGDEELRNIRGQPVLRAWKLYPRGADRAVAFVRPFSCQFALMKLT